MSRFAHETEVEPEFSKTYEIKDSRHSIKKENSGGAWNEEGIS